MKGGQFPKGFLEQFNLMLKGTINWRTVIRDMVTPEMKTRTNFSRPSRRSMTANLQLPSMKKEGLDIVVAIDTSGSMSEEDIGKCIGELRGLFNQFDSGIVKVHLMLHTSKVYSETILNNKRDLEKVKIDSGGTSHMEVFEKAEKLNSRALICFTDAMSEFPPMTSINNVLWILPDEKSTNYLPKYGKNIIIKNI
jgi:predicted metal-dependent peptidase